MSILGELYCELANLVPASTKSSRDLEYEVLIKYTLDRLYEEARKSNDPDAALGAQRATKKLEAIFGPDYLVIRRTDYKTLTDNARRQTMAMREKCAHLLEELKCDDEKVQKTLDLMADAIRKIPLIDYVSSLD